MTTDTNPTVRARVALAAGAALLLGAIVVATVVASGDGDGPVAPPADARCLRAWNLDPAATAYGRHNFKRHYYDRALVTLLDLRAREADRRAGGRCAVIFPARALDPEPFAAGQILVGGQWLALSSLYQVSLARVGELQARAAAAPNATLGPNGRLGGLDG